ncbi:hypothetical protein BKA69DRAFT_1086033 [Paraphysoderma sedebokerense]|nr:hypothetical protein BKA69DRAFT_1086033 [Paraphysoderma sedebokerense]
MQVQIASLAVIVLAVLGASNAAPILPAAIAGLSVPVKVALGTAVAGTVVGGAAAIHGATTFDQQRHARFEFVSPNQKTNWKCGSTQDIKANTFGFGSLQGIDNSKLTLLNGNGEKITEIMNKKTSQFLKEERTMGAGRARNGQASYSWFIPENIEGGVYRLEFESFNALNMDRSRFRFTSDAFTIDCTAPGPSAKNYVIHTTILL